jgi:uncharacterized protein
LQNVSIFSVYSVSSVVKILRVRNIFRWETEPGLTAEAFYFVSSVVSRLHVTSSKSCQESIMRSGNSLSPIVRLCLVLAFAWWILPVQPAAAQTDSSRLKLLFLGDNGPHRPADRFGQLQPILERRGIDLTYTDSVDALNAQTLGGYDGLVIYANIRSLSPEQEQALLEYVAGGKGFIPIHSASYCFLNSPKYIALVGGQFQRHGAGVFRTTIAMPDHPIMKGFDGFESWDETYVHHRHNEQDRVVLSYRVDAEGKEPWTWVRTHGQGRVFYTAWGHDQRTWGHPGFHNLIERGIRWAVGGDPGDVPAFVNRPPFEVPQMTPRPAELEPFEYVDANIAFYDPAGGRRGGGTWNKMQLPVPAERSLRHMVVPAGFRVELFAAEPDIGKPICMNWDEQGRLWLCETVDYPNELQPPGQGRDRIRICEDTTGDGRADRFTIFADKLSIPTSLTFSQGGVIVHQAPHTLFLKDTTGDGRADVRRVLFTGWDTSDTHAGPSNLHYGLDNWMWGMVGYAGFNGRVGDERHRFRQGIYRFKPDGSQLEFLRSTNNNTWGLGFSEEGLVFGSTANRNPSIYLPIPNRYYEAVRGWSAAQLGSIADTHLFRAITDRIRQVDHHNGYTAAAGHALYTARAYPQSYWNRAAFVCEPTGHLVGTFVLSSAGSDFQSTNPFNLLASDDEWTAPIMAEVGPDGQVWVIDWYNYIVQHNPTPAGFRTGKGNAYITDLRDKKHGRIYRVVYEGSKAETPVNLKDASPEQLVATLAHDNMFWRKHAQRLLVERGNQDVVPALLELVGDTTVDPIGLNTGAIHALWTLHGLGALDGEKPAATAAAIAALQHPSAGVRRNAVEVLTRQPATVDAILKAGLLEDADAQVRLAALLALSEMRPNAQAATVVVKFLRQPANVQDRWIRDAATSAAAAHDLHFLKAIAESGLPESSRMATLIGIVAEHYARGGPADSVGSLLLALAEAERHIADAVISGFGAGWPQNRPVELTEQQEQAAARLLTTLSPGVQGQLVRLAATWGSQAFEKHAEQITQSLLAAAADETQSDEQRIATARQLIEFRPEDRQAAAKLLEVVSARTSPALGAGVIDALALSRSPETGAAIIERLAGLTPAIRAAALRVLLSRAEWTRDLLKAAEEGQVALSDLSLDQKQALAAHPDATIAARAGELLKRGGGLPNPDRAKVLAELLPLTDRTGDAALGKTVFQKHCAKCHTHRGEGTKVGPDLTGMAVHPKAELLTHIIDPSRSVEGNYRAYTVVTQQGRIFTGMLASETRTSIELFDTEGKRHAILRDDIEELAASNKSIMPEGFEKQMPADELVNLLEFLTERGRYLPLPLAQAATIVSTRGMFHSREAEAERLVFRDWSPKTFEGIPFHLIDPQGDRIPNVILLNGPNGRFAPQMPRSVRVPCNSPARALHLLSGVSGWGHPFGQPGTVSMIVRLHYHDGATEDHPLLNGEHFADYIRRVDVPGSKLAYMLRDQQVRYLAVHPQRAEVIREVEFVKGEDQSAPIVMAVTVEGNQ